MKRLEMTLSINKEIITYILASIQWNSSSHLKSCFCWVINDMENTRNVKSRIYKEPSFILYILQQNVTFQAHLPSFPTMLKPHQTSHHALWGRVCLFVLLLCQIYVPCAPTYSVGPYWKTVRHHKGYLDKEM